MFLTKSPYSEFFTSGLLSVEPPALSSPSDASGAELDPEPSVHRDWLSLESPIEQYRSFLSLDLAEPTLSRSSSGTLSVVTVSSSDVFPDEIDDQLSPLSPLSSPLIAPFRRQTLASPSMSSPVGSAGLDSRGPAFRRSPSTRTSSTVSTKYRKARRSHALACLEGRSRAVLPDRHNSGSHFFRCNNIISVANDARANWISMSDDEAEMPGETVDSSRDAEQDDVLNWGDAIVRQPHKPSNFLSFASNEYSSSASDRDDNPVGEDEVKSSCRVSFDDDDDDDDFSIVFPPSSAEFALSPEFNGLAYSASDTALLSVPLSADPVSIHTGSQPNLHYPFLTSLGKRRPVSRSLDSYMLPSHLKPPSPFSSRPFGRRTPGDCRSSPRSTPLTPLPGVSGTSLPRGQQPSPCAQNRVPTRFHKPQRDLESFLDFNEGQRLRRW
ncbi:hypothetical protein FISHEDRAFT_77054 [Fistulina hepatica ATCC 64428]|uniref:Uncharacterized protein n=1 Tax=Fistulina hepatica ATCC 64428 TaxID=1128425 RepID=A0A0D7A1X0_9AGAR|nr:hypothetical protein FISHEDRAFT_77054 [Fistulina hepatica ATCC 64428]